MMRRALVLLGVGIVGLGFGGGRAAASTTGAAEVVGTDGAAIASGGSATPFSLEVPPDAACNGDSANAGYRVQSYMVPAAVDPSGLHFGSTGPLPTAMGGAFREPLYTTTTSPYVNAQTANAEHPNEPGAVVNIPVFNFAVFARGDVPPGVYNVGIACTRGSAAATVVERVWNARVTVATDASDAPAAIRWTTDAAPRVAATASQPPAGSKAAAPVTDGAAAVSERVTAVHANGHRSARVTGAPPSLGVPALDLFGDIRFGRPAVLAVCAALALLGLRVVALATRKPILEPVPAQT